MVTRDIIKTMFLNKRVRIKNDEYTYCSREMILDCYAGDTGVVEYVDFDYGSDYSDLAFVIELDESLFKDGRMRSSKYVTCDFGSFEFICKKDL